MEVVALEVAISLLMRKLGNLLAEKEITHRGLRSSALKSVGNLEKLQKFLGEKGSNRTGLSLELLLLLRNVYSIDDMVDNQLFKSSSLKKRLSKKKASSFSWLMYVWSQQSLSKDMKKLAESFNELKDGWEGLKDQETKNKVHGKEGLAEPGFQDQEKLLPSIQKQIASSAESSNSYESDDLAEKIILEALVIHKLAENKESRRDFPTEAGVEDQTEASQGDMGRATGKESEIVCSDNPAEEVIPSVHNDDRLEEKKEARRGGPPDERVQISPSVEESDAVGLEDQVEELVHLVLGSHKLPYLISVSGVPGSGKTTLVRRIFTRIEVKQHFDYCAWINLSKEFEEREVLIEILRQVSVITEERKLSLESLTSRVHDFLVQKRYLIVLDDVHSSRAWENLGFAFPRSLNGSRVILTIQDNNGVHIPDQLIWPLQVRLLNNEESWELFLKKVKKTEDVLTKMGIKGLKENVLAKCGGLPLKIVLLGGLLLTKEFSYFEWSRVILSDEPSTLRDILAMGYRDLPPRLKPCLLYIGLFPKSYEIPIRRLFRLWIAEGLAAAKAEERLAPEDLVKDIFEELVKRNMIEVAKWRLDRSPKTCRVPGVLYDTLFPCAADMGFFHVHCGGDYKVKPDFNFRRIAEHLDISNNESLTYHIQDIRSYICFCKRKGDAPADEVAGLLKKIVSKRGFALLTVLDLEGVYKPQLNETLGKLLLLKYLGLRWTFLDSVPMAVGKLPWLETLDVKHTNITKLPIAFWKAEKLRHLYMNDIHFYIPRGKPFTRTPLANLQTLSGLLIGSDSSVIVRLQRLVGLKKLALTCHESSIKDTNDWIAQLTDLRSLKLRSIDSFSQPSDLKLTSLKKHAKLNELHLLGKLKENTILRQLSLNLRILTLSVSQLTVDPMPILGQLPNLNILSLLSGSYLGEQMACLNEGFPQLRVMKLWMLEKLVSWSFEQMSMPSLVELEIRCCPLLKLRWVELQKLATLKKLILTNMPEDFPKDLEVTTKSKKVFVQRNTFDFCRLP